ncbi:hypothetical protein ACFLX4_00530 [Chloroflexota bacterium]
MVKDRNKPPSRIRYEQSHPVISTRISAQLHEQLKEYLASREESLADFIRESLGVQKPPIEKIEEAAWNKGYDRAEEDYRIRYPCSKCGKGIEMLPGSSWHKAIMKFLEEKGFKHQNCP